MLKKGRSESLKEELPCKQGIYREKGVKGEGRSREEGEEVERKREGRKKGEEVERGGERKKEVPK